MKNPDKVLIPARNLILISLRENEPDHCFSFTLLIHILLNLDHGSATVVVSKWIICSPYPSSGSRSKVSNRVKDRLVEFIQSFPLQSPVEYLTYVPAIPSKVNVILVVGHSILEGRELAVRLRRVRVNLPESW